MTSRFDDAIQEKDVQLLTPKIIAQIACTEWTESGKLRHPRYLRLREDKKAEEVTKES